MKESPQIQSQDILVAPRPLNPDRTGSTGFFSFEGRIPRLTFWLTWISISTLSGIVSAIAYFVIRGITASSPNDNLEMMVAVTIYTLLLLLIVWVSLAMQVKRWHDRGKSGWMVLVNLIPVAGLLWSLIELGFLRGTTGPNQYGKEPLLNSETNIVCTTLFKRLALIVFWQILMVSSALYFDRSPHKWIPSAFAVAALLVPFVAYILAFYDALVLTTFRRIVKVEIVSLLSIGITIAGYVLWLLAGLWIQGGL